MSFTDDALKRIKAACLLSVEEYSNKDAQDILALIARLEAAEAVIKQSKRSWTTDIHNVRCMVYHTDWIDSEKAWRKVAGK